VGISGRIISSENYGMEIRLWMIIEIYIYGQEL
jgi:hypothetical protein